MLTQCYFRYLNLLFILFFSVICCKLILKTLKNKNHDRRKMQKIKKIYQYRWQNVIRNWYWSIRNKKRNYCDFHGYPLISFDLNKIITILIEYYRVVTLDHLGFGFSVESNNFNYSLIEDANTTLKLCNKLKIF